MPRMETSPVTTQTILYAKSDHGGYPILVTPKGFQVVWPSGPVLYTTRRKLIHALYDENRDPGVSFDRYFKTGRWESGSPVIPSATILDMFGQGDIDSGTPVVTPRRPKLVSSPRRNDPREQVRLTTISLFDPERIREMEKLTAEPPRVKVTAKHRGLTVSPVPLGIDLDRRGHEVRKLLFAGFGAKMARGGYDPDDVLQEIYRGILARNRGKCPFDARKSSFGHYVHMVCECVLANYHRKESRRLEFEQVGYPSRKSTGESHRDVDASLEATDETLPLCGNLLCPDEQYETLQLVTSLQDFIGRQGDGKPWVREMAVQAVPLMCKGYSRKDIAQEMQVSSSKATQVISFLRAKTAEWRGEMAG